MYLCILKQTCFEYNLHTLDIVHIVLDSEHIYIYFCIYSMYSTLEIVIYIYTYIYVYTYVHCIGNILDFFLENIHIHIYIYLNTYIYIYRDLY